MPAEAVPYVSLILMMFVAFIGVLAGVSIWMAFEPKRPHTLDEDTFAGSGGNSDRS